MTKAELESELAKLIEVLRPGGTQAYCEALRRKIEVIRTAFRHGVPDESDTDDERNDHVEGY